MTSFSSARLGVLFRQRAQLTDDLRHAYAKAERLTLEHNELVRRAGQAATDGGTQRAQLQASRKGEEAARAREHADALSRQRHEKETEIADLIGALRAASQSLLSAGTIRQPNDHLGAISDHLERADGWAATLIPELNNLRTAIRNQSRLISSLNIERTDSHDGRDHDPGFPPNRGVPVAQMGWRGGSSAISAPRAPQLRADAPARHFAASLYSGLAFGNSVKRAFHQACATIGDEPDSVMPQLFFRHGIDPHTVVLVRPEQEEGGTP